MKFPMKFKSESVRNMEMAMYASAEVFRRNPTLTVEHWKKIQAYGNREQRRRAEKKIKELEAA